MHKMHTSYLYMYFLASLYMVEINMYIFMLL